MMEIRLAPESINIRSSEDGRMTVTGHASVFNQRSRLIAEQGKVFNEVILPGAFDSVLSRADLNVIANVGHDDSRMLARTKSGTLFLQVDAKGLMYEFTLPNTTLGRDLGEQLERGDIFESSFKFTVKTDDVEWKREDGVLVRYIKKVANLYDVALVVNGAYANTDVALRELNEFEQMEQELEKRAEKPEEKPEEVEVREETPPEQPEEKSEEREETPVDTQEEKVEEPEVRGEDNPPEESTETEEVREESPPEQTEEPEVREEETPLEQPEEREELSPEQTEEVEERQEEQHNEIPEETPEEREEQPTEDAEERTIVINNEEQERKMEFNLSKALVDIATRGGLQGVELEKTQELSTRSGVVPSQGAVLLESTRSHDTSTQDENIDQTAIMPLSIIGKEPVWQRMGCRYLPNLKGTITLPYKSPIIAAALAEKAALTHDTVTNNGVLVAPQRYAVGQIWTKELLASENPALHNAMVADMITSVDRKISADVYAKALAGATEVTITALDKAGLDLLMGGAEIEMDGVFASSRATFFEAKGVAIDSGSGRFLATIVNKDLGATYEGIPWFYSSLFADGTNQQYVIYGDFSQIVVADWGMYEVLVNPYTYAKEGQIEIVVSRIANVSMHDPNAFAKSEDLDAAV